MHNKEALEDLKEIKDLIQQAERVVDALVSMLPPDRVNWLAWRHQGIRKRLNYAQADLFALTERLQVMMLRDARPVEEVVEPKVNTRKR